MTLKADLSDAVQALALGKWDDIPNGTVVPTTQSLTFANTGTRLQATVLYADIHRSTEMVDSLSDTKAAEYYKSFLLCAGRLVRDQGGAITAYDGDRIMAVYLGDEQSNNAVRTAMKLSWAVANIINPLFASVYSSGHRALQHTVGIDCGTLLVAKTGVRGDNDLVWVGSAANYAAKLNSFPDLDPVFPIRATRRVIDRIGLMEFVYVATGATIWNGPYNNLKNVDHWRTDSTMEIT
jgi:class 3 adenylate cyclase